MPKALIEFMEGLSHLQVAMGVVFVVATVAAFEWQLVFANRAIADVADRTSTHLTRIEFSEYKGDQTRQLDLLLTEIERANKKLDTIEEFLRKR